MNFSRLCDDSSSNCCGLKMIRICLEVCVINAMALTVIKGGSFIGKNKQNSLSEIEIINWVKVYHTAK